MAKTNADNVRGRIGKCYLSKGKYRNLRNYFEECASYSSLHGVKYLGERDRTWIERIGWLTAIVISIAVCGYFVHETYKKWQTTPILVTVGTAQLPIQHVTFPAVTVCPAVKVNPNLVQIMEKIGRNNTGNITEEEILSFKHVQMWCQYSNYDEFQKDFGYQEKYDLDSLEYIFHNTPAIDDIFWSCQWNADNQKRCSDLFTSTFTEEGVCYTFNSLNRSSLFELGVIPFRNFNTAESSFCYDDYNTSCRSSYPYRTTPGVEAGLQVFMRIPRANLNPCIDVQKGHRVIIHQPNELPSIKNNYFYVPLTESVTVALTPEVITTDENLRSYTVEQRKCYYDDEKNLTHYKYYTQKNCEAECYLYLVKLYWKCVDFYMPHTKRDTDICNGTVTYTVRRLGHHIMNHLANTSMNVPAYLQEQLNTVYLPPDAKEICSCLPSCKSLKYHAEITQTDYDPYDKKTSDLNNDSVLYSKVSIYFKEAEFIPYERKEMFGLMDFVAYCGGLLGLFTGFSFIALLELIYFICFRPVCNVFLFGKKSWAGHPEKGDEIEQTLSN